MVFNFHLSPFTLHLGKLALASCLLALGWGSAVGQETERWRVGFDLGLSLPSGMGSEEMRSCYVAHLRGSYDVGEPGGWFPVVSVGHLRTLKSLNADFDAVPMDTAVYLRRYIVYLLTAGVGYDFDLSPEWLDLTLRAEAGAAYGYQKHRHLLSLTATNAHFDELALGGWMFVGSVGAELFFWKRFGLGIGMDFLMNAGKETAGESAGSKTMSRRERVDHRHGKLGDFSGALFNLVACYRF